jgi:hypothetical protein
VKKLLVWDEDGPITASEISADQKPHMWRKGRRQIKRERRREKYLQWREEQIKAAERALPKAPVTRPRDIVSKHELARIARQHLGEE